MKYKSKLKWLFILVAILVLIAQEFEETLNPLDPVRSIYKIGYFVAIVFVFFFCIYDRIQIKRFYRNAKGESDLKTSKRLILDNTVTLVICLLVFMYATIKHINIFSFFT